MHDINGTKILLLGVYKPVHKPSCSPDKASASSTPAPRVAVLDASSFDLHDSAGMTEAYTSVDGSSSSSSSSSSNRVATSAFYSFAVALAFLAFAAFAAFAAIVCCCAASPKRRKQLVRHGSRNGTSQCEIDGTRRSVSGSKSWVSSESSTNRCAP